MLVTLFPWYRHYGLAVTQSISPCMKKAAERKYPALSDSRKLQKWPKRDLCSQKEKKKKVVFLSFVYTVLISYFLQSSVTSQTQLHVIISFFCFLPCPFIHLLHFTLYLLLPTFTSHKVMEVTHCYCYVVYWYAYCSLYSSNYSNGKGGFYTSKTRLT